MEIEISHPKKRGTENVPLVTEDWKAHCGSGVRVVTWEPKHARCGE